VSEEFSHLKRFLTLCFPDAWTAAPWAAGVLANCVRWFADDNQQFGEVTDAAMAEFQGLVDRRKPPLAFVQSSERELHRRLDGNGVFGNHSASC
jgi:hypothetical protein